MELVFHIVSVVLLTRYSSVYGAFERKRVENWKTVEVTRRGKNKSHGGQVPFLNPNLLRTICSSSLWGQNRAFAALRALRNGFGVRLRSKPTVRFILSRCTEITEKSSPGLPLSPRKAKLYPIVIPTRPLFK